jgi:hypothetical protein
MNDKQIICLFALKALFLHYQLRIDKTYIKIQTIQDKHVAYDILGQLKELEACVHNKLKRRVLCMFRPGYISSVGKHSCFKDN